VGCICAGKLTSGVPAAATLEVMARKRGSASIALESHDDLVTALQEYQRRRIPWVAQVVRYSRKLFDSDERHGPTSGHQNPLLARYDQIVERNAG